MAGMRKKPCGSMEWFPTHSRRRVRWIQVRSIPAFYRIPGPRSSPRLRWCGKNPWARWPVASVTTQDGAACAWAVTAGMRMSGYDDRLQHRSNPPSPALCSTRLPRPQPPLHSTPSPLVKSNNDLVASHLLPAAVFWPVVASDCPQRLP
jgi:hypothetical protein